VTIEPARRAELTEVDGRTRLEVLTQCPNRELRDMIIESGMEGGMQVSFDRLEDLVTDTPD
jgi:uncharacterized protein YndB with AHSA1/START domain